MQVYFERTVSPAGVLELYKLKTVFKGKLIESEVLEDLAKRAVKERSFNKDQVITNIQTSTIETKGNSIILKRPLNDQELAELQDLISNELSTSSF